MRGCLRMKGFVDDRLGAAARSETVTPRPIRGDSCARHCDGHWSWRDARGNLEFTYRSLAAGAVTAAAQIAAPCDEQVRTVAASAKPALLSMPS